MEIWRRKTIRVFANSGPVVPIEAQTEGLTFRRLQEEDFSKSRVFAEKGRRDKFLRRLHEGHVCAGFVDEAGGTVSYVWLSRHWAPFELGLVLRLEGGEVYLWDCRTVEAYRGRGLYRQGLRLALATFAPKMHRAWIVCEAHNVASIKGISAAGFHPCAVLHMTRLYRPVLVRARGRLSLFRPGATITPGYWATPDFSGAHG